VQAPAGTGRGSTAKQPSGQEPEPEQPPQESPEEVAGKYFEQADLDQDGWVLYGEAEQTMGLSKQAFAAFDRDLDFRISRAEYASRYIEITSRGGAFPAPRTTGPAGKSEQGASALLTGFDSDGNKAIDELELRTLLSNQTRATLDPQVVMTQLDRESDKRLKDEELEDLAHLLDPSLPRTEKPKARSIDELFGRRIPREEREGAIRLPDQIQGPVDSFRRLDIDADGRITEAELADLLRPVQTSVRLSAVFATLDKNRDGGLSREEFWSALGR
jgi:Ca2+-binding EF-hand superfamily protein